MRGNSQHTLINSKVKSPNSQLSHLTYSELLVVTPAEPTPEVQKPRKSKNQRKIKEKPRIVQKTLRNITWVMVWALPIAQTITHVMFRFFLSNLLVFPLLFVDFLIFLVLGFLGGPAPSSRNLRSPRQRFKNQENQEINEK